jgi:cell division GTPase FtsZ
VGIVTLPFLFEGKVRQEQAKIGIEKLRKQVDSLIVINNNKLKSTEILVLKLDFQKRMKFGNNASGNCRSNNASLYSKYRFKRC